ARSPMSFLTAFVESFHADNGQVIDKSNFDKLNPPLLQGFFILLLRKKVSGTLAELPRARPFFQVPPRLVVLLKEQELNSPGLS
ncbi:MAG: hypothetical protein ACKO0V_08885, partial [bacterium]